MIQGQRVVIPQRVRTFLSPKNLYIFAFILIFGGFICLFVKKPFGFLVLSDAASGVFSIGYLLKVFALAKDKFGLSYSKVWPVASNLLFSGFVFLSSGILAHVAVSKALELPVKDFGTTVQIVSIAFYLCAWLLIGLILFLPAFLVAVLSLMYHIFKSILLVHVSSLADIFSFNVERWRSSERASHAKLFILFGDVIGTITICLLLAFSFDKYRSLVEHQRVWIERIAYLVDYQDVMRYPDIDHTRRICFHDNGVISYATTDRQGMVSIEVTKITHQ